MKRNGVWGGLSALLLAVFFLSGCLGYGFRGSVNNLPEDIKTVAIPIFVNESNEPGLETVLTNALIYEFTRSRILQIVPAMESHAIIFGKIKSVAEDAAVYTSQTQALERRITVVVEASCRRTDNDRLLWQDNFLSRHEIFTVSPDAFQTQRNREEALKKIAQDLSERIHNGILENF